MAATVTTLSARPPERFGELLWRLANPYRFNIFLGILTVVLTSGSEALGPYLLKKGVDFLQAGKSFSWITLVSGAIIIVSAVGGFFRFLMRKILIGISRWIEFDLREHLFTHLLRLSPSFYDHHYTGDLMARATDDIERVRMVAGPAFLYVLNTQLTALFSLVMMFAISPSLAFMLLLLAPLVGGGVLIVARSQHRANLAQQNSYGELSTLIQETLAGLRVVKSFARETFQSHRFRRVLDEYYRRSLRVARLQALMQPLIGVFIGGGIAGILFWGGRLTIQGGITLGSFIAFTGYLTILTWPMIALGWVIHLYQRGSASYERLRYLFNHHPQFETSSLNSAVLQVEVGEKRALDDLKGVDICLKPESLTVEMIDISFRYHSGSPWVLRNFHLHIPSGAMVALVGKTGAGKSTVARILTRLYDPEEGYVKIGGVHWKEIPVSEWRKLVSLADQTPFIFSTTIEDNLRYARPEATSAELLKALSLARFTELDQFPRGLATLLGERGVTLSGGQQQRLSLARALLRQSPILILDDALSAVDAETEGEIINSLKTSPFIKTIIVITHRLTTAEKADIIALLEDGKVVEAGPPEQLLANEGPYSRFAYTRRLQEELKQL